MAEILESRPSANSGLPAGRRILRIGYFPIMGIYRRADRPMGWVTAANSRIPFGRCTIRNGYPPPMEGYHLGRLSCELDIYYQIYQLIDQRGSRCIIQRIGKRGKWTNQRPNPRTRQSATHRIIEWGNKSLIDFYIR